MSAKEQVLLAQLKEVFLHVADAVDGGEKIPAHLKAAYNTAMAKKPVFDFYTEQIEEANELFGF